MKVIGVCLPDRTIYQWWVVFKAFDKFGGSGAGTFFEGSMEGRFGIKSTILGDGQQGIFLMLGPF